MNLVPKVRRVISSIRVLLVGVLYTIGILSRTHVRESVPLAEGVKSQFEREASVYDATRDVWVRGYRGKMEQTLIGKYLSGNPVLEIGTGTGRAMTRFARRHDYYGIDLSYKMLKIAKDKVSTQKLDVELLVMDGEHLSFRRSTFESVVVSRTLKYLQNPDRCLLEVKRVLKTNGRSMITCETSDSVWHRMVAGGSGNLIDMRFSVGEIVSALRKAGFNKIGMEPLPSILSP